MRTRSLLVVGPLFAGGIFATSLVASSARADTLEVGPGKTYAAPCAAFAAAKNGDTILIDGAGTYQGDVCAITKNSLTIKGVNGRPKIDANGQNAQGKAIWVVVGDGTTIDNIEFFGCSVPDQNGAAIRQEGANLLLTNSYIHDNDDGILAGDNAASDIVIKNCEFALNGFGDGYSHNLYVNHVHSFTFTENWSHKAKIGHLLKSRAAQNFIFTNRLTGEDGTDSYELDFPNGGTTVVVGNLIEQGTGTDNPNMLAFGEEGASAGDQLTVVNNTFVNDKGNGTFILVDGSVTTPSTIRNNIFFGAGSVTNQMSASIDGSCQEDPLFVDAANFDYHLKDGSPCKDAGIDPGPFAPTRQYVHPANGEARTTVGTIDIGAYEFGGGGTTSSTTGSSMTTSSTSSSMSTGTSTASSMSTGTSSASSMSSTSSGTGGAASG